jgi:hypothetical protein
MHAVLMSPWHWLMIALIVFWLCLCLCFCWNHSMEDGRLVYVRESKQEALLLMHLLVVALDLEGWRMGPAQFEMLRRELKTTPTDVVNR